MNETEKPIDVIVLDGIDGDTKLEFTVKQLVFVIIVILCFGFVFGILAMQAVKFP